MKDTTQERIERMVAAANYVTSAKAAESPRDTKGKSTKSRLIPKDREEDVLYMFGQLLSALESKVNPRDDMLDKHLVNSAYNVLNDIGYTTHRPPWEKKS